MGFVGVHDEFPNAIDAVLSREQKRRLEKIYDRVAKNPLQGRLLDARGLREFRIDSKRVYFITDGEHVLFVDVSDKKRQQETIKKLQERFGEFSELLARASAHE